MKKLTIQEQRQRARIKALKKYNKKPTFDNALNVLLNTPPVTKNRKAK